jgi:hypothetical protein
MLAYVRVGVAIAAVFVTWQRWEEREDSAPVPPYPQHNGNGKGAVGLSVVLLVVGHGQSSHRFKVSGANPARLRRQAGAPGSRRFAVLSL